MTFDLHCIEKILVRLVPSHLLSLPAAYTIPLREPASIEGGTAHWDPPVAVTRL